MAKYTVIVAYADSRPSDIRKIIASSLAVAAREAIRRGDLNRTGKDGEAVAIRVQREA